MISDTWVSNPAVGQVPYCVRLHARPACVYTVHLLVSSAMLGAVLVDQYCNPLADVTLDSISAQLDEITDKVKKMLRIKNPSHPSLRIAQGGLSLLETPNEKSLVNTGKSI